MSTNLLQAHMCTMQDEYYKIPEILIRESQQDGEVLSLLGKAYFFMGRFEQSYEVYQKLYYDKEIWTYKFGEMKPEEYDPFGKVLFSILEESDSMILLNGLPKYMNYNYEQSIEDDDENYEEYLEYRKLVNYCLESSGGGPNANSMFQEQLTGMENSKDIKLVAKSHFYRAELSFSNNNLQMAYKHYLDAAVTEISKALYYGYAGNMLMKLDGETMKPTYLIGASILTHRAIDLDKENAKWHYNEALILRRLSDVFSDRKFLYCAKNECDIAYRKLRIGQVQLRNTIERYSKELF